MDKVFEIYAYRDELPELSAELALPATPYELLDMLERLGAEDIDSVAFQIGGSRCGRYLSNALEESISIQKLNAIAWKMSKLEDRQKTALDGLVKMECRRSGSSSLPYEKILQLTENAHHCHVMGNISDDAQLGKFYAENGFVPLLEDLPEEIYRLLDFEKIGQDMREAEGGVFTPSGYVALDGELKELTELPNLDLTKPPYTILLEVREKGAENGPMANIKLPVLKEKLEELQKKYHRDQYWYRCIDCAVPFFREYISSDNAELQDIGLLARRMDSVQELGLMAKYKAVLQATGCQDVELAAELGRRQVLAKYRLIPPQGDRGAPAQYAVEWLRKKLGEDAEVVFPRDMEHMGRCLVERHNVEETDYGLVQWTGREPIQRFDRRPEQGPMEMTM